MQARELNSQIEGARRAFAEAQLQLAEAMGNDMATNATLPEPEGELQFAPMTVDLVSETKSALERRADLKLARLLVRAANEEQRIIEAAYYPTVAGGLSGYYVPVTGIYPEGSPSRTDDFFFSEGAPGALLTWEGVGKRQVDCAGREA